MLFYYFCQPDKYFCTSRVLVNIIIKTVLVSGLVSILAVLALYENKPLYAAYFFIINSYMDNFYYQHIDIENYQEIIKEARLYILNKVNSIHHQGFAGLKEVEEFKLNCPSFVAWLNANELTIRILAVHIMNAGQIGQLHSDSYTEESRLSLNLNIENCDATKTRLYEVSEPGVPVLSNGGYPYFIYKYDPVTCKKITEYDVTSPLLFDTSKPHQVTNYTNKRRVCLTIRFTKDPVHLLK